MAAYAAQLHGVAASLQTYAKRTGDGAVTPPAEVASSQTPVNRPVTGQHVDTPQRNQPVQQSP
eukprot:14180644-Alexandrium_andersonii.AAC.1